MKQVLVNKELAILAKTKGFGERTEYYYYNKDSENVKQGNAYVADYFKVDYIIVPSQTSLKQWLEEKFNIHFSLIYWGKERLEKGKVETLRESYICNENKNLQIINSVTKWDNSKSHTQIIDSILTEILNVLPTKYKIQ